MTRNNLSSNSFSLAKLFLYFCLPFVLVTLAIGCRGASSNLHAIYKDEPAVYTKYNIHAQDSGRDIKASYAGYVDLVDGHIIIPAGSKIDFPDKRARRNGFFIKVVDTGQEVFFEYHEGRMEMSEQQYVELITADEPVSIEGFSEVDQKGIKAGKAFEGMSREGVLTALGYPATHRTPSLESSSWTYWRNRFATMVVEFNVDGFVENVRK